MRSGHPWILMVLLAGLGCDDSVSPGDDSADVAPILRADGGVDRDGGPTRPCRLGDAICVNGQRRTCLEDESGWLQEACPDPLVCVGGACREAPACLPGERGCDGATVVRCDVDGQGFVIIEACAEGESCLAGACLPQACAPGELACGEGVLLTCAPDGLTWARSPCAADEICVDGACGPPLGACDEGRVLCGDAELFTCVDGAWDVSPCEVGEVCFAQRCVECVRGEDCPAGVCAEGRCVPNPPEIVTAALPVGQIGADYEAQLEGEFGEAPYDWSLIDSPLPGRLRFEGGAAGRILGTPFEAGTFPITVGLRDAAGHEARRDFDLVIVERGLQITTDALPDAEEGEAYEVALEALGGQAPLGWFLTEGVLPAGVALGGDGVLRGVPSEVGDFDLRVRVVDSATPPAFAEADLRLTVTVAPLRIVGDQVLDLFVAKLVTLPTITVIPNIPGPYETRLQARGGLRPLRWAEQDVPAAVRGLIPRAGIPEGLVLEADGRLHGAVVSLDDVIELPIPFTQIVLSGYFFFAEVRDSQGVPDQDAAMFVLPTLPIGQ